MSTAAFTNENDSAKIWEVNIINDIDIPNIFPIFDDRWFSDDFISRYPEIVDTFLRLAIAADAQVFLTVFGIYVGTEKGPWLHEITVLSLILTEGNHNGCNPRHIVKLMPLYGNSELVILPTYKLSIL